MAARRKHARRVRRHDPPSPSAAPASEWSDRYFALHLDGSLAGVLWIHLDAYTFESPSRRKWPAFWRLHPPEVTRERLVTVDYAYGSGPGAVDYVDDHTAGSIEQSDLWADGDTHEVVDGEVTSYVLKELATDQATWVKSWFANPR